MILKLDADGHVVVENGKPVYVDEHGKDIAFDAPGTAATIARLNAEAKTHREGKQTAEQSLKATAEQLAAFEGIDPVASRKALATLKDIDAGKLIDAGRVDEVRAAVAKEYEGRLTTAQTGYTTELAAMKAANEQLTGTLHNEMIGGSFARSKYAAESLAIPADMVQAKFGQHFKLDGGKVVATDASGNMIYSRARPGEVANFDEALSELVGNYANKDHILKPSGANGSGANASAARIAAEAGKGLSRADFDALAPKAKMAHVQAGLAITE